MAIYADKKDGRPTGRWRVEVQKGRQRARGRFDSLEQAKAAEALWHLEMPQSAPERDDKRGAPKTLSALIEKAQGTLWRGKASGELQETRLNAIAKIIGGSKPLVSLGTTDLDTVVLSLLDDDLEPSTVNKYLSALHKLLVWGSERKWVSEIPVFPWQDEEGGRIRWLTEDEELHLYRLVPPHVAAVIRVAIETGMRSSELLSVTWANVNFDRHTIFLPNTKNGSPRTVPLSTRALNVIRALPRSINGRLFSSGYHSIHNAFKLALTKAQATQPDSEKFLRGLRFHDLRHEAVTRLFEKGLNPIEVSMVSGHKTLSMLQRYTHLRSEDLVVKLA